MTKAEIKKLAHLSLELLTALSAIDNSDVENILSSDMVSRLEKLADKTIADKNWKKTP